jgi:hypothetical protein
VGNDTLVSRIDLKRYVSGGVGEPTLQDILAELKKPGRDPRKQFEPPKFRDDVNISDLELGMELEGVVTNVTLRRLRRHRRAPGRPGAPGGHPDAEAQQACGGGLAFLHAQVREERAGGW